MNDAGAGPPADAQRALYLANLEALYRADAALAARIDALPFAAAPAIELARDGRTTLRLTADDGKPIYAHSRFQPAEEAQRAVAALAEDVNPTFVLHGCGLAYHVTALEARFEAPLLIVLEPDLGIVKAALCTADLQVPLGQRRLLFLTTPDKGVLHALLLPRYADLLLGTKTFTLPYTERCRRAAHAQLRELLTDFMAYARMQMVTLLRNARITNKNIAHNLGAYVTRPGIDDLRGRAAGLPAIVVAAGPSLSRALDRLVELQGRAVIIAVQTVFKLLLARGIRPHFVTSLDFHEVSGEFFRDTGDVGDCTLVAEAKATWHVIDRYPGPVRLLHARFAEALLRESAPPRAALKSGSTVAHLAFYLAQFLGCDPIIFVGQDLCFADGLYYPPGMPIEDIWSPEMGRFQTVEMKQWERIVRGRPILRTVSDVCGRSVFSDEQLVSYAEQFESDFAASSSRIILTGETGQRLSGATVMSLDAAATTHCANPLPDGWLPRPDLAPVKDAAQRAQAALELRLEEIAALREIATEMRPLLDQLVAAIGRPEAFNRTVARVDALRNRIRRYDAAYGLVVEVAQRAELQRYGADRRLGERATETPATAAARLRRDREFVDAFLEGCAYLEEMLPAAQARLREHGQ